MLRFGFPLPAQRPRPRGAPSSTRSPPTPPSPSSRASPAAPSAIASSGPTPAIAARSPSASPPPLLRAAPRSSTNPTATLWEAIVRESGARVAVELWPRGLADPRFAYRVAHVPASSHPTLAAAMVRVAGARPDDVVWDPFVGAATELVERARLGPARALFGSDADDDALARARENLAAAGVEATLARADARSYRPPIAPTLIVTNPPLGRRVLDRHSTGALYRDFLAHAATLLPRGGRLIWISPRGDETVAVATPLGLPRHLPPARRHGRLLGRDPVVHQAIAMRDDLCRRRSRRRSCGSSSPPGARSTTPTSRAACKPPTLALADGAHQARASGSLASGASSCSRAFVVDGDWGAVVEVLKHEMAHQFVTEALGDPDDDAARPGLSRRLRAPRHRRPRRRRSRAAAHVRRRRRACSARVGQAARARREPQRARGRGGDGRGAAAHAQAQPRRDRALGATPSATSARPPAASPRPSASSPTSSTITSSSRRSGCRCGARARASAAACSRSAARR